MNKNSDLRTTEENDQIDQKSKSGESAEERAHLEDVADDHRSFGNAFALRGFFDGAEESYREALAIDREHGFEEGLAIDYACLGEVYQAREQVDEAEGFYRKALAIYEKLGHGEGIANQYGNLGTIHAMRGDLDEAENMYRQALATNEELGRKEGMAAQYGNLGIVCRVRGDLDEAESPLFRSSSVKHSKYIKKPKMTLVWRVSPSISEGRNSKKVTKLRAARC